MQPRTKDLSAGCCWVVDVVGAMRMRGGNAYAWNNTCVAHRKCDNYSHVFKHSVDQTANLYVELGCPVTYKTVRHWTHLNLTVLPRRILTVVALIEIVVIAIVAVAIVVVRKQIIIRKHTLRGPYVPAPTAM